jgi:prepilin-type processing-associated H-X9-DG protein
MEQDNLFRQISAYGLNTPHVDTITQAAYTGTKPGNVLPAKLPYIRCPSDVWRQDLGTNLGPGMSPDGQPTDYVGCGGAFTDGSFCAGVAAGNPFGPQYCPGSLVGLNYQCGKLNGMFAESSVSDPNCNLNIASCTDGTSNTYLIGESLPDKGDPHMYHSAVHNPRGWATFDSGAAKGSVLVPINWPIISADVNSDSSCDAAMNIQSNFWNWGTSQGFKSNHPGGANFAFADGSVHFITQTIDPLVHIKLGVRNDGAVVELPF